MHKQGIIHRDLKPENIMFAQDVETNIESEDLLKAFNVKIIDLGMSAYYAPNNPLKGNNYCTTSIGFTASRQPFACANLPCICWMAACFDKFINCEVVVQLSCTSPHAGCQELCSAPCHMPLTRCLNSGDDCEQRVMQSLAV